MTGPSSRTCSARLGWGTGCIASWPRAVAASSAPTLDGHSWVRFPNFMTSACVAKGTERSCSYNIWHVYSWASVCTLCKEKNPNYLIPFPLGGTGSFHGRKGCWKKNGFYLFLFIIWIWNPVMKMYVAEEDAGRRGIPKTTHTICTWFTCLQTLEERVMVSHGQSLMHTGIMRVGACHQLWAIFHERGIQGKWREIAQLWG